MLLVCRRADATPVTEITQCAPPLKYGGTVEPRRTHQEEYREKETFFDLFTLIAITELDNVGITHIVTNTT